MISSCTSFTFPLNQLVISVDDVPPVLRSTAFLMAFGVLIVKPIEVDQDSWNPGSGAPAGVVCGSSLYPQLRRRLPLGRRLPA